MNDHPRNAVPSGGPWSAGRFVRRVAAWARFRLGVPHENDYAFFGNLPADGLFVDVGAATGQSARSLRIFNGRMPILSLEPNPLLEGELRFTRWLLGAGYEYRLIGLSDRDARQTLYVPLAGGAPLTRFATTDRGRLDARRAAIEQQAGRYRVVEVPVEMRRFDGLDLRPQAVKIDAEGAELTVLEGMHETLARDEPILMIEDHPEAEAVAGWLAARGYRAFEYEVDGNLLRETGDLCGKRNFFALTAAAVEALRKGGELSVRLAVQRAQDRL